MTVKVNLDESRLQEIVQNAINDGLLEAIGETVVTTIQERFTDTNEAPDGEIWKPLSQFTLGMRRSRGDGSEKILINTGALETSITFQIVDNKVDIGTAIPYASKHNQGFGRIPKRQFIGELNESDRNRVMQTIREFFEQ